MPDTRLTVPAIVLLSSLVLLGCEPVETTSRNTSNRSNPKSTAKSTAKTTAKSTAKTTTSTTSRAVVRITASDKVCWTGQVGRQTRKGCGNASVQIQDTGGNYRIYIRKTKGNGSIALVLVVNGNRVDSGTISASSGIISINYASS